MGPKKLNVFIWRAILDRIPTRKNLSDMNIDIPSTLCPFCEENEENSSHIFFDCPLSTLLWAKMEQWWNFTPQNFRRFEDPLVWAWFAKKKRIEGLWLQVSSYYSLAFVYMEA